nr:nicotinate phosphoribosyltransferase 2-like [Tanacetum cinerariifolium]
MLFTRGLNRRGVKKDPTCFTKIFSHKDDANAEILKRDEVTEKSLKIHNGSRECKDFISPTHAWLGRLKVDI